MIFKVMNKLNYASDHLSVSFKLSEISNFKWIDKHCPNIEFYLIDTLHPFKPIKYVSNIPKSKSR